MLLILIATFFSVVFSDSVSVVLKGFEIQYQHNLQTINSSELQLDWDWKAFTSVNNTIAELQELSDRLHETEIETQQCLSETMVAVQDAQTRLDTDIVLFGAAAARLTAALVAVNFSRWQLELAELALNAYTSDTSTVLDSSTSAAIDIIGEIPCAKQDQNVSCNYDAEGVLQFWALHGCRVTTGFVCTGSQGTCMCPQSAPVAISVPTVLPMAASRTITKPVKSVMILPVARTTDEISQTNQTTSKDYAIFSAGTLKTVVEDILKQLSLLQHAIEVERAVLRVAEHAYELEKTAAQNMTEVVRHDVATLIELTSRQVTLQAQLASDFLLEGSVSTDLNATLQLAEMLKMKFESELPGLQHLIEAKQHSNEALVSSAVMLVSTINCRMDLDCQDLPESGPGGNSTSSGSMTFFAELGCGTQNFVCRNESSFNVCGC